MQELIGQIAATIIGGTIILILAVIAWRGQNHATSSVQYSAAKEGILDFAEVMEEDLSNMGAGRPNTAMRGAGFGGFTGASSFDSTASLEVYSWIDRDNSVSNTALNYENAYDRRVRYVWQQTGTVQVLDPATQTYISKDTYRIDRFVDDGSGSFDAAGSSIDTLTEIDFTFRNAAGTEVDIQAPATTTELQSIRSIEITLQAVSPLGGGTGYLNADDPAKRGEIEETRWTRTIRPPNLIRVSN